MTFGAAPILATFPATSIGQMTVSKLDDVAAWVNKMSGTEPPSLHIVGTITAPTPCHVAVTEHIGDSKTEPPGYLLKVMLRETGGFCIQVLSDINFHHIEQNYAENHAIAEVSSDTDNEILDIKVVQ